MAVLEGIPIYTIQYADIRDTLNANGGTVTNDYVTAFSLSANINMWSKHKPVINPKPFCQDVYHDNTYDDKWWKGIDGNCGLVPATTTDYKQIENLMDGELNGWKYILPSGGENQPLRMSDFGGYAPSATPFIYDLKADPKLLINSKGKLNVSCAIKNISNSQTLSIVDLDEYSQYYFGALVKQQGGGQYRRATNQINLGAANSAEVEIDLSGVPVGKWEVIPFLSQSKFTQDSPDIVSRYTTIPNTRKIEIEIISAEVLVYATIDYDGIFCYYNITVTNYTNTEYTYYNNYIAIRYNKNDEDDPFEVGEASEDIGTITVPPNAYSYKVASGNLFAGGIQDVGTNGMYGLITLDSGRIRNTAGIRNESPF